MVDLKPLFTEMKTGLMSGVPRFEVTDAEHVTDTHLGVEYHLYDPRLHPGKPYKLTTVNDNETLLIGTQLTGAEADILDDVRTHLYKYFTEKARTELHNMAMVKDEPTPNKMNVKPRTTSTKPV